MASVLAFVAGIIAAIGGTFLVESDYQHAELDGHSLKVECGCCFEDCQLVSACLVIAFLSLLT
jgi:hypothetical protein